MSCVLPHPAGAVIAPRFTSRRSISGADILDPAEYASDDGLKAFFTGLKRRTDDFPTAMLHGAHGLKPRRILRCAGLCEMLADIRRHLCLTRSESDRSDRSRFEVLFDQRLAV